MIAPAANPMPAPTAPRPRQRTSETWLGAAAFRLAPYGATGAADAAPAPSASAPANPSATACFIIDVLMTRSFLPCRRKPTAVVPPRAGIPPQQPSGHGCCSTVGGPAKRPPRTESAGRQRAIEQPAGFRRL